MPAPKHRKETHIPPLEWAAAAVGLALVCGALGVMVTLGLTRDGGPAVISVRLESVTPVANGYVATLRATNRGAAAAADVTVEGELRTGAAVAETSTMSFKYLAPHSERRGGLFFERDPRAFELRLKPKGYEIP